MKKFTKAVVSAVLAVILCGCSAIPDLESIDSGASEPSGNESSSSSVIYDESEPDQFDINKQEFVIKLNAEGGVFDKAETLSDGDFDGKGYVRFKQGGKLTHIVNTNTAQHYRFVLAVRSETGASISISLKDKTEGMFYVPPSEKDSDGNASQKFVYAAVDCVYLVEGKNVFSLNIDKGTADIDYIIVESSENVDRSYYRTGTSAVNPYASLGVVGAMKYFSDIYGEYSLTAVNVSVGTNAEIDAVYSITGRYPAIRGSELAYAVLENEDNEETLANDIELAKEWSKNGGIVSYKWHWYSPNRLRSVKTGAFDLTEAFRTVNLEEIALMTNEDISLLNKNGYVPSELYSLITDIDKLSESLSRLKDKDVVTVFEPIPNADSGLYWWGDDPANYKKLYALIFNRLCKFHRLSNLIFVYNGGNIDYYPGAEYCDIVGQSFFENSGSAFAGRFYAMAKSLPTRKMLAVTACDVMTSADFMSRDNAIWLFSAIESGQYLIDENGAFSSEFNTAASLRKGYNSTLMLTRDELPDINKYVL
ncbi:MAG: hypothetical protein J1F03_06575 [Oscillospiraceae bacterium]|nr:hypothetical protein [Oscillospiraceae bacterium]